MSPNATRASFPPAADACPNVRTATCPPVKSVSVTVVPTYGPKVTSACLFVPTASESKRKDAEAKRKEADKQTAAAATAKPSESEEAEDGGEEVRPELIVLGELKEFVSLLEVGRVVQVELDDRLVL